MPIQFTRSLPPSVATAVVEDLLKFRYFSGASEQLKKGLLDVCAWKGGIGSYLQPPEMTLAVTILPVFAMMSGDLVKTDARPKPRAAGWRIAARIGSEVLAADIQSGKTPIPLKVLLEMNVPRVSAMRRGPDIRKMLESIARLPESAAHREATKYNTELVLFPGLFTETLWIRPETSGHACWVVPFHTLTPGLEEGKIVDEKSFLQIMREFAVKMHAEQDAFKRRRRT